MNKKSITGLLTVISFIFSLSCAQTAVQTKSDMVQAPKVKAEAGDDTAVRMINEQVKGFSIDGFPGGSSKLRKNADLKNMKRIVTLIKPIIDSIPDGYIMQITGHAADYPTAKLQKSVSTQRAKAVYRELVKSGVPAAKLSYRGAAISEPLEGYPGKSPKQRRVSFKAVKK